MESFEEELKKIKQELENKGRKRKKPKPEMGKPPAKITQG